MNIIFLNINIRQAFLQAILVTKVTIREFFFFCYFKKNWEKFAWRLLGGLMGYLGGLTLPVPLYFAHCSAWMKLWSAAATNKEKIPHYLLGNQSIKMRKDTGAHLRPHHSGGPTWPRPASQLSSFACAPCYMPPTPKWTRRCDGRFQ